MRIKILMVGEDPVYAVTDMQILRDKGFLVYTCFNTDNINEVIEEIKPDILFIDFKNPNMQATEIYNAMLSNMQYITLPIIYTLAEDEVYLVNRKRTALKERRNIIADNILDAIKMALRSNKTYQKRNHKTGSPVSMSYPVSFYIARA